MDDGGNAPFLPESPGPTPDLGDEVPAPPQRPPVPAVDARELGLHGHDRWAYRDVDLVLPQGSVLVVSGPGGSGRSTLLLTLTGRMRATDGLLTVFGHPLPERAKAVRALSAVARAGRAVTLEPGLTVAETVRERALLEVVALPRAGERFDHACAVLGLDLHRHALVGDLPGVEQTRLAIAVALVGAPRFLVVDDLDAGLHSHEEALVWQGLRSLADAGLTVAGATSDPAPGDRYGDVLLPLRPDPVLGATKGRFH